MHTGDAMYLARHAIVDRRLFVPAEERDSVLYMIGCAERIAYDYGATPREDLVRMTADPQSSEDARRTARDIILNTPDNIPNLRVIGG